MLTINKSRIQTLLSYNDIEFDKSNVSEEVTKKTTHNIAESAATDKEGMPVDWYQQSQQRKDLLTNFGPRITCTNLIDDLDTLFGSDWGWIPVGQYTNPAASKDKTKWVIDQGIVAYQYKKKGVLSERIEETSEDDTLVAILAYKVNEELAKWLLDMHDAKIETTPIMLYHQISQPCKVIECLGKVSLDIVQSIAQQRLIFKIY